MDGFKIEPEMIHQHFKEENLVSLIISLEEIDSTNEYLKRNAARYQHGTLVIAETQTAGKGSKGRSWESEKGSGIWMSLLLKPQIHISKAPMLTLVMAISIARASRRLYNLPILIKWPNDIVCHGKKLCGILTEMKSDDSNNYDVVIGIGVNVNNKEFPEEITKRATSVFLETGMQQDRSILIANIMDFFTEDYRNFIECQNLSGLLRTYSQLSATVGQKVCVLDVNGKYLATAISVNREGHLLVEKEDKTLVEIYADEVSVRGIYGYVPE